MKVVIFKKYYLKSSKINIGQSSGKYHPSRSFFLADNVYFSFLAGNESCPQPQTSEHLAAIEIMKLKHMIILQNKIDLVKETQAKEQYEQILAFVKGIALLF